MTGPGGEAFVVIVDCGSLGSLWCGCHHTTKEAAEKCGRTTMRKVAAARGFRVVGNKAGVAADWAAYATQHNKSK